MSEEASSNRNHLAYFFALAALPLASSFLASALSDCRAIVACGLGLVLLVEPEAFFAFLLLLFQDWLPFVGL